MEISGKTDNKQSPFLCTDSLLWVIWNIKFHKNKHTPDYFYSKINIIHVWFVELRIVNIGLIFV